MTVTKGGNDFLMVVSMFSEDGSVSAVDVGDYISSNLVDVISRVDGVGEVQTLGTGYAMRIWLDPDKLRKYALMPSDVNAAVTAQNAQVSAGQLGALPATSQQQLNATITARSKLQTVEQFSDVVLRATPDGAVVRLKRRGPRRARRREPHGALAAERPARRRHGHRAGRRRQRGAGGRGRARPSWPSCSRSFPISCRPS